MHFRALQHVCVAASAFSAIEAVKDRHKQAMAIPLAMFIRSSAVDFIDIDLIERKIDECRGILETGQPIVIYNY